MLSAIRKIKADLLTLFFLILVIFFFLHKLFLPQLQLLITPSQGHGDSFYFSIPTKFFLWENLQKNITPLWSKNMGGGFPILGEGQTGIYFLPNQILFRLPNFVLAYNLSLYFSLIVFSFGVYVWLRILKISELNSFFASSAISLSGLTFLHLEHHAMLQGFSLLPWVLISTHRLIEKLDKKSVGIFSLIVSQQIFSGYPQTVIISLIISSAYLVFRSKINIKIYAYYLFALLLAAGLSAIQLLPSYEFQKQTQNPNGLLLSKALEISFPINHLLTYIDPFVFGNPKYATYNFFPKGDIHIFWESIGYMGTIAFLIIIIGIFLQSKKYLRIDKKILTFWLGLTGVSILLMLGQYSPVFEIFSIWPLSWFRVPARYIWIFNFSLTTAFALILNQLSQQFKDKKIWTVIILTLLSVNTFQLYVAWNDYNSFDYPNNWLRKPIAAGYIKEGRIFKYDPTASLYNYYVKNGYKDLRGYKDFLSEIGENSNLLWNISSQNAYAGRALLRPTIVYQGLFLSEENKIAKENNSELNPTYLNLLPIKYVISTVAIESDQLRKINTLSNAVGDINIYENIISTPRAYLASNVTNVSNIDESTQLLLNKAPQPGEVVVENLNKNIPPSKIDSGEKIEFIRDDDSIVELKVTAKSDKLLVLGDTYYPGWKSFVDEIATQIYPVNVASRGVYVPKGTHIVKFKYEPDSWQTGKYISSISIIIFALLLIPKIKRRND